MKRGLKWENNFFGGLVFSPEHETRSNPFDSNGMLILQILNFECFLWRKNIFILLYLTDLEDDIILNVNCWTRSFSGSQT